MTAVCDRCKTVVTFRQQGDPGVYVVEGHPDSCPQLTLTLVTENPRKLGVVTGLSQ